MTGSTPPPDAEVAAEQAYLDECAGGAGSHAGQGADGCSMT